MKKRLSAVLCALTVVLCLVFLCGCEILSGSHLKIGHNVDTETWQCDGSGHWHPCSHCDGKFNFEKHSVENGVCSVCNHQQTVDNTENGESDGNSSDTTDDNAGGSGGTPSDTDDDNAGGSDKPVQTLSDSSILSKSNSTYGYTYLGKQTNGSELQKFYNEIDAVAQKVFSGQATVSSKTSGGTTLYSAGRVESANLTANQVRQVYQIYCYDHPYNFWQDQAVYYGTSGSKSFCEVGVLEAFRQKSTLVGTKTTINANINDILTAIGTATSAYERTASLYTEIALLGDYTYDAPNVASDKYWAHSIVGLLDDDTSTGPVCEGYARVLQLLCNIAQINNIYCVGSATAAGTGGGGGHAWNMLQLDEKWYWCDLTWDDANDGTNGLGGNCDYTYFLKSQNEQINGSKFAETHTCGTPEGSDYYLYNLPAVSENQYASDTLQFGGTFTSGDMVFVRNGLSSVAVRQINGSLSLSVTVPSSVEWQGKTYTVTALGPNFNENGAYTSILKSSMIVTVEVPTTVVSLRCAAFYNSSKIKIKYLGTREQWSKVTVAEHNNIEVEYANAPAN